MYNAWSADKEGKEVGAEKMGSWGEGKLRRRREKAAKELVPLSSQAQFCLHVCSVLCRHTSCLAISYVEQVYFWACFLSCRYLSLKKRYMKHLSDSQHKFMPASSLKPFFLQELESKKCTLKFLSKVCIACQMFFTGIRAYVLIIERLPVRLLFLYHQSVNNLMPCQVYPLSAFDH